MKCIILAGGVGERLWPISRDLYPKSLLKLDGGKTLIQNVFELAKEITTEKNIVTVTNVRQSCDIKLQLKDYTKNPIIISEPAVKNTAPAIASAITYLENLKDEMLVVLPVDFVVEDKTVFSNTIKQAQKQAKKGGIVAIGVRPTYEESGFGFIQVDSSNNVVRFVEKPQKEEVEFFTNQDDYFWNCGIYVGKISEFKKAYEEFAPEIISNFSKEMFKNANIDFEYYANLPEISVDYAIIEKISNLQFIELKTNWYDLGSWQSIYSKNEKDSKNNVFEGNVLSDKVSNSFVYSSKELVAVSGVKDKVIIETEDAVLVCSKDRASEINKLVKKIKDNNDSITMASKTMYRPWGYYTCLNRGEGYLTKLIGVSPKSKLSLQSHNHRSEHWIILEGQADVVLEDNVYTLEKGQSIDIPLKAKHSLQNNTNNPLKILEVQKGDYISEDDIIRYNDMYGRV